MRQGLSVIHIYIIIMSLRTVLNHIQDYETNVNRRSALVKTLLLTPKLAKNIERIAFLVTCRKAHVFPKLLTS